MAGAVLAAAGCAAGPMPESPGPVTSPSDTPGSRPTAADAGTAASQPFDDATDKTDLRFLTRQLPSDRDLDLAIADAHDAYLAHRALYDAAARTGFTDPVLFEELVASAGSDLQETLFAAAEQLTAEDLVIDGSSMVVGIQPFSVHIPVTGDEGLQVTFDACVVFAGAVTDRDGTAREGLSDAGHTFISAHMVEERGRWVVWSQYDAGGDCPPELRG